MKLIIDIPEKAYSYILKYGIQDTYEIDAIIANGIPYDERPQGEWKTNLTTGDIFCSCCKEVRRDTRIKHINFCNSCGADMRGDKNNE